MKRHPILRKLFQAVAAPIKCDQGQALVEFGLVSIVFLTMVFGIIDFARLMQSWVTVQYAAREGARYALTGRSDCATYGDNRLNCIIDTAKGATTGLYGAPGNVTVKVRRWAYPNYANPPLENSAGVACDSVEVEVDYNHQLITPLVSAIVSHVSLAGKERALNEPFGPCGGT